MILFMRSCGTRYKYFPPKSIHEGVKHLYLTFGKGNYLLSINRDYVCFNRFELRIVGNVG